MDFQLIDQLKTGFSKPLPGREAQFTMAHTVRRNYLEATPGARQASVLALFYPKANDWHLVLIERASSNPNDQHRGQISLPGGKVETSDPDLSFTALREAEEEVGIDPMQVNLLGQLTDLYIPVSNFVVFPFVGWLENTPTFRPQLSEVRSVLEIPFQAFLHPDNRKLMDKRINEKMILRGVPYFAVENQVVWGATAMILGELTALVNN